jgi:hypothetical protein
MDLVVPMINAPAIPELMPMNLLGFSLIALAALVLSQKLGLVSLKEQMTLILSSNAPTKVFVIAPLVNVNASRTMMVLPASALSAPMVVVMLVFASLKSNLLLKLTVCTPPHGMPRNTWDAFAILAVVVQIVLLWSAPRALM